MYLCVYVDMRRMHVHALTVCIIASVVLKSGKLSLFDE